MAKGKTAQKWAKKEVKVVIPYKITGGPLTGYNVVNLNDEVVSTHKKMWDAIIDRDKSIRDHNEKST